MNGDPQRGLRQTGALVVKGDPNPNVDNANRGKRTDPNGKLYKRLLRER